MSGPGGGLIALEGADGAGKSVQAALLARAIDAELTREPGGTGLGEAVRCLVLGATVEPPSARAEALLMLAARAEHVERVVRPALERGRWVVSDRFSASTLAYQGWGRGLEVGELALLDRFATGGLAPTLNVLLDVPEGVAAKRRSTSGDRLDREPDAFHARVRAGFSGLVASDPDHWVVVDGVGTVDEVASRVLAAVSERLRWLLPGVAPGATCRPVPDDR